MPVPVIVIAVVIRVTPIIISFVARQAAKQAMKTIAAKWPKIKIAIDTALGFEDIKNDAKDTLKKSDDYFTQAKIVDDIRLEIEKYESYHDYLEKNINALGQSLRTTTDSKTLKNINKSITASEKSLESVEDKLDSLNTELDEESEKLDPLSLEAAKSGIDLIKTVADKIKSKKRKGRRGN